MWVYQYDNRIALESLKRMEWPDPEPGSHDIVIQMGAVALNHRDIAIARGHADAPEIDGIVRVKGAKHAKPGEILRVVVTAAGEHDLDAMPDRPHARR